MPSYCFRTRESMTVLQQSGPEGFNGKIGLADNLAPDPIWHRTQFGTKSVVGSIWHQECKRVNLAPDPIWHQEYKRVNLAPDPIWHRTNLAPRVQKSQFGTGPNLAPESIWHQECKGVNLAPVSIWHRSVVSYLGALTGPEKGKTF